MYYILSIKDFYNSSYKIYLFSTYEKAEEWIDNAYYRKIVPSYKIIEIENIDDENEINKPTILNI